MDINQTPLNGKVSMLAYEKSYFDAMHRRVKGFKTLTLWVPSPWTLQDEKTGINGSREGKQQKMWNCSLQSLTMHCVSTLETRTMCLTPRCLFQTRLVQSTRACTRFLGMLFWRKFQPASGTLKDVPGGK